MFKLNSLKKFFGGLVLGISLSLPIPLVKAEEPVPSKPVYSS